MEITQERVDAFADATDDHQWIHVDREKAAAGPFGGTIAHGFLTLSLTVTLTGQVEMDVGSPVMAINYGLEKVRFPAPVPVGSRIRARVGLVSVSDVQGGIQVNRQVTIEVEGTEEPGMVAETVSRYYY
jgi:acyl dehydratase